MNKKRFSLQLLILSIFLFYLIGENQVSPQVFKDETELKIQVDVRLKLIDVIALDSEGKTVKDLVKYDIELFIDGASRKIDTFDLYDYKSASANPFTSESNKLIGLNFENSLDKRKLIFIFNDLSALKARRRTSADSVINFLYRTMSKNDLVSIYYMQRSSIILILPFTDSFEQIRTAIDTYIIENKSGIDFRIPEFNDYNDLIIKVRGVTSLILRRKSWMVGNIEDFNADNNFFERIQSQISPVTTFSLFIRSLAVFKGRKEVFLFSDSLPKQLNTNSPSSHFAYQKLIQEAKNSNIVINYFDLSRFGDNFFMGGHGWIDESEDSLEKLSTIYRLNEYLLGLAGQTNGLYYLRCNRRNEIKNSLNEVYDRSSVVYYLGSYINDLPPKDGYKVEIKTKRNDIELIYHNSFSIASEYKKMDRTDKELRFLEALYGTDSFKKYPFKTDILQFPYDGEKSLIITSLTPDSVDKSSVVYDVAVRYYCFETKKDVQQFQKWDISKISGEKEFNSLLFLIGALVEEGEYNYRCVLRDSDAGDTSNLYGNVKLGVDSRLISSPVVLCNSTNTMVLANLFLKKNNQGKEVEKTPYLFDLKLNPFMYNGRALLPLLGHPIDRDKPAYLMFMYNLKKLKENDYTIRYNLIENDGSDVQIDNNRDVIIDNFPNGWQRVTLKLPLEQLPPDCKELKFNVSVKDRVDKEIESETIEIVLK